MAIAYNPKTVTDGLVLAFDAANPKSYVNIPGITDHGISDWYCFDSGTVTYSAIYPNTQIIEIDSNGNETVMVTTGSDPQRGTFSITADRRYYGTKAIHLMIEDNQYAISPASFAGIYFAHYWNRYSPMTYYAYAPQDDTELQFFDNNAVDGVDGTATATYNIPRGSSTSFQSTAESTWQFFKANKPIIMTAGATSSDLSSSDRTVLSPASQYVYQRRENYNRTINNAEPSLRFPYVTYDDASRLVMTVEIGDGLGREACQGIGYEYLSDTFSWGNVLADYQIVAPYADTTVTVSYWANNQWNVGEVHSLSGTQTNPDAVDRDGTNGFGVDGTTISGGASNLANGADLWKWESTKPIALIINDSADDEENMLGWMSNNYIRTSSNVYQSLVNLVDRENTSKMSVYGKNLTTDSNYAGAKLSASQYIEFDGVDDYISISNIFNVEGVTNYSASLWIKFDPSSSLVGSRFFWHGSYGVLISKTNTDQIFFYIRRSDTTTQSVEVSVSPIIGVWVNIAVSYDGSTMKLYINGDLKGSESFTGEISPAEQPSRLWLGALSLGVENFWTACSISQVSIYNRTLTASEISQNYLATKSRYF